MFLWGNADLPCNTLTVLLETLILSWWDLREVKETNPLQAALQGSVYFGINEYLEWRSGDGSGQAEMQLKEG